MHTHTCKLTSTHTHSCKLTSTHTHHHTHAHTSTHTQAHSHARSHAHSHQLNSTPPFQTNTKQFCAWQEGRIEASERMKALMKENNVNPLKTLLGFAQIPVFLSFFFALRGITSSDVCFTSLQLRYCNVSLVAHDTGYFHGPEFITSFNKTKQQQLT